MKKLIAAALLLGSTATPALAQESYRASGTEPFWSLTIGPRTMTFEAPGQRSVTVPTPRMIHGFAGEIWQAGRIGVNTVHKQCSDGMSDRTYRDTVTVTVDGRRYEGCGGGSVSRGPRPGPGHGTGDGQGASIMDGTWAIEAVDGRPVGRGTHPEITFRNGRISGNASCNTFSGGYSFSRGSLTAGPLAVTKRMCALRVQNVQEHDVLQALGQRLRVSSNRGGKLVLTGAGKTSLTLAPARGRR